MDMDLFDLLNKPIASQEEIDSNAPSNKQVVEDLFSEYVNVVISNGEESGSFPLVSESEFAGLNIDFFCWKV